MKLPPVRRHPSADQPPDPRKRREITICTLSALAAVIAGSLGWVAGEPPALAILIGLTVVAGAFHFFDRIVP